MKKVLFLLAMAVVSFTASAQITWNAKAGVGYAHCWGDTEGAELSGHIVGKLGVGIEKPLTSNWSFMPSFEVALKGAKEEFKVDNYSEEYKLDLVYLQVPLMFAYRLNLTDSWNTTLKAGPYLAYAISDKVKYSYSSAYGSGAGSESAEVEKFDAGLILGVDFEHHRWVVGAEYEFGFMSMYGNDWKVYNAAFYVTAGYKF